MMTFKSSGKEDAQKRVVRVGTRDSTCNATIKLTNRPGSIVLIGTPDEFEEFGNLLVQAAGRARMYYPSPVVEIGEVDVTGAEV